MTTTQPAAPHTRFSLPAELAATMPPEERGLARDAVRLLVSDGDTIEHARFADLGQFLRPGDLLVVNTSATRAAAIDGEHSRLGPVVVHFSTEADDGSWVIELRTAPAADRPVRSAGLGDVVHLPDGTALTLRERYPAEPMSPRLHSEPAPTGEHSERALSGTYSGAHSASSSRPARLWRTQALPPGSIRRLLARHGRPIRYGYLSGEWPLAAYQTVFADLTADHASAEMASAGRPFSIDLVRRLTSHGVRFAPITLDAGVSSMESGEPPLAERFRVPAPTAALVNQTRLTRTSPNQIGPTRTGLTRRTASSRDGTGRVIAVGTTVTRALESAADPDGTVHPAEGWTELVLGPDRPVRTVTGLITGMHDPDASHLLLLEAVAGPARVQAAYDAALDHRYLWHEFGDSCLLLP